MRTEATHSARTFEILNAIVQEYIETGEPVASRTVSRRHIDALSPASVRNAMADLSDAGYLAQPHTSAGRVPTEKAFQYYVRSLAARRLPAARLERLRGELSGMDTLEARIERSSRLLTEMTRSIGIAATIPAASQSLERVELVSLGDRRVLMVVITGDQLVHDRVVSLDETVLQPELNSIRDFLNSSFGGWSLNAIQRELEARLETERAAYDSMLKRLMVLYDKGLLDLGQAAPALHLEGASYLVGLDLHLTRETMRELFRALEEKKRILQLLERFIERPSGEVGVRVGLGEAHPSMRELSLIGLRVDLAGGLSAKIAVLGPMRMNYERAMSAVLHVGRAFASA